VDRLEIKRRMDAASVAEVADLLDTVRRADGHPALGDQHWLELSRGGGNGFAGLVASQEGHPHPVGYAQVSRANAVWGLALVIDPHHRYEAATIGPRLLAAALDVVAHEGGGTVHWWVFEPTHFHRDLAAAVGMHPGRRLHQMRRALPLTADEMADIAGFEVRPFRPGADEEAWLAVNNRAFAGHPEQGGWDEPTLRAREDEPWFDASGFLLHETAGRLDGFCWTKLHHDIDPLQGEIYVIAVDPSAHGSGLGKRLTLAGLRWLGDHGAPVGMLYVDAANEPANRLYERLGFTVHHTNVAFVGHVEAASPR
jgi:mycothiol synthase